MRRQLATLILTAAIGPVLSGLLPRATAQVSPPAAGSAQAGTAAVGGGRGVPVKRVVLYTSGVGYFEHFGTVHGDASTVLSFKTDQINDVLKSLLLEDLDGGRVTGVSYPTLAPLAQTLKSFQVDLSNDPPLADILKQLRGAQVTATLPTGPVNGQVLGVEEKDIPVGTGADAKVAKEWIVNVLNDSGIVPVELDKVTDVKLDDPELAGEMTKALAAVAMSRDKDKKPVTISFAGQGDHRVRLGYVVETPIWKASYRLSLGEQGGAGGAGADIGGQPGPTQGGSPAIPANADPNNLPPAARGGGSDAGRPTDPNPNAPGAPNIPADQQGKIQGWAIVDNQTDNDWAGVELSLVSGRPISFIEDLYQPLYVPRPTVVPDLFAGLVPQTYDEGLGVPQDLALKEEEQDRAPNGGGGGGGSGNGPYMHRLQTQQAAQSLAARRYNDNLRAEMMEMTPQASGAKVGEAFEYTVHDVNLARQKSSMIPILSGPMQAERLSIYNASVLPNNPLLGARLTNTSGGYIMQGPVTVLDHGIYAGDAQILDMPPSAQRLISYGVDQRMHVNGGDTKTTAQVLTGKIVKGELQVMNEETTDQTYIAANKSDADKLLIIEHPRQADYQLVAPAKPAETTDSLYRFELPVPAGKSASLRVQEVHFDWQAVEILPNDATALLVYSQLKSIPQPVKDALNKAIQLKQAVTDADRDLAQVQQDKAELSAEQDRMRKNMQAVSAGTDYYKKLLNKMDGQETQFEQMETHEKQLVQEKQDRQKQLEDYLSSLTVG